MNLNLLLYGIYLLCLVICAAVGAMRWRNMRMPLRMFYLLIIVVFLAEITALVMEYKIGSNTQVYNITDILQAVTIIIAFTSFLKWPWTGWLLGLSSALYGIYNYFWIQPSELINNYFLMWKGLVVIFLCVCTIIRLYKREGQVELTRFAYFWLTTAILMYWIVNLLPFQVFNLIVEKNLQYAITINAFQLLSNIFCYSVVGLVFYHLRKLIQ